MGLVMVPRRRRGARRSRRRQGAQGETAGTPSTTRREGHTRTARGRPNGNRRRWRHVKAAGTHPPPGHRGSPPPAGAPAAMCRHPSVSTTGPPPRRKACAAPPPRGSGSVGAASGSEPPLSGRHRWSPSSEKLAPPPLPERKPSPRTAERTARQRVRACWPRTNPNQILPCSSIEG